MNVARVNFDTDKFTLPENNWLHMVYYIASFRKNTVVGSLYFDYGKKVEV